MMYNKKYEEMRREAIESIIEALENGYSGYYCDLHNEVFNTDYYVYYTDVAKNILREYDVFEAIELVQNYEETFFGEINTELSNPCALLNMVWYIIGDEVMSEICRDVEIFDENFDNCADDETNEAIVKAIKEKFE